MGIVFIASKHLRSFFAVEEETGMDQHEEGIRNISLSRERRTIMIMIW